jgi:predicted RNase H-like nuclease (RuvC/YqgF family)
MMEVRNLKQIKDSDLPFEVRMKYIIDAYRKDQVKWGWLYQHAKRLDDDNSKLREKIERLQNIINRLQPEDILQLKNTIKCLETKIEKVYPKRKYKLSTYKRLIKSQEDYIAQLQKLLDSNGILYPPRIPLNNLEIEGADSINVNAVR